MTKFFNAINVKVPALIELYLPRRSGGSLIHHDPENRIICCFYHQLLQQIQSFYSLRGKNSSQTRSSTRTSRETDGLTDAGCGMATTDLVWKRKRVSPPVCFKRKPSDAANYLHICTDGKESVPSWGCWDAVAASFFLHVMFILHNRRQAAPKQGHTG